MSNAAGRDHAERIHRPAARSWQLALLTPEVAGQRNRRTLDGFFLAVTAIATGVAGVVARSSPAIDADVGEAVATVLGWAPAVWKAALAGALALAVVIVTDVLVRRRWLLGRDLLAVLAVVVGLGGVLGRVVDSGWWPEVDAHLYSNWGFPDLRLACAAGVLTVAGPELVRPIHLAANWLLGLAAVGAVAIGAGQPSQVLGGLALGLGAGALVRLVLGSAAGVPSVERVLVGLAALGVEAHDLRIASRQRVGSAEYVGHASDGEPIKVRVLGRDAQDTQRLARHWRLLAYRDPPKSVAIGRLEQVEHEALATLMAAQAGVRVPAVVAVGLGPLGDAIIVTRQPDVDALEHANPAAVSDELLADLLEQVRRLHDAGISHGRLNLSNVVVDDTKPVIVDLAAATLAAPQSALDIDLAELLVACTLLVGPKRALDGAVRAGYADAIGRALPYLQRGALTPHVRDLAHDQDVALKELRTAAAAATGTEAPELVPLHRIRPKDVITTVFVGVAAYVLITQLAEIGFGTIADSLHDAEISWAVLGLIVAQLTFVTSAVSLRGAVLTPLALGPCIALASAVKFVNLTVPSSAGRIAFEIRFLQRMGAPTGEAVAAGAVDKVSETIVELTLVLALLPFVDLSLDTSDVGVPSSRIVGVIALVLVALVVVVLAVPSLRAKIVPSLRQGLSSLGAVAKDRRKRLELFGGNLGTEVLFALTLGAVCHAYGVSLMLVQLLVINMAASALSSLIPSPGGVGTAEAGLTAGLVAVGVDDSTAFAIAFTHRLCTNYLPPIWGYVSLQWLARKNYV
jgi:uncharacterized membrane protein YbhN (UPF0104 family)/tRNA A-37 threonylcarbamoyl transferase component Bud32